MPTVWIVDDDSSVRWVLDKALRSDGIAPRCFDAAAEVLDTLAQESPDVLITDVRMPGMDGMQLLEVLESDGHEFPVIVMTAHADLDAAVTAYRGGAFEYLPKPFDVD
ncbi:MAG TPA: response regulator, partial [Chromatiales bacterium]|nr:response regulator [Chromatiales bacterium]